MDIRNDSEKLVVYVDPTMNINLAKQLKEALIEQQIDVIIVSELPEHKLNKILIVEDNVGLSESMIESLILEQKRIDKSSFLLEVDNCWRDGSRKKGGKIGYRRN